MVAGFNAIFKFDQRVDFGLAKTPYLSRQCCFI